MTRRDKPTARIVYFGTDAFSVPALSRLIDAGWPIAAVITKPDATSGRGRHIEPPAVKTLAKSQDIPVLQPENLAAIADQLLLLKANIGIVVAYGKLIPPEILDIFPQGLLNIHASLLPRYRGASPIESAMLNGDPETGVTLMQIEPDLDTGPTYAVAKLPLNGTEIREQLYVALAGLGADLLASHLEAILSGQLTPTPQDSTYASVVGRISKADGILDWTKPAEILERQIRAYHGWPSSRGEIADTDVTITTAHLASAADQAPTAVSPDLPADLPTPRSHGTAFRTPAGELAVTTGSCDLIIDFLKPAGKREMPARDFLAGHHL